MKKTLYHYIIPKFIRKAILNKQQKEKILSYYSGLSDELVNDEEKIALDYLKNNKLCVFPYPFQENYKPKDIKVYTDNDLNLKYILFEGKRLYFRRKSSSRGIKRNYNYLLIEQDLNSPHRYLSNNFNIENNDILVDVGAAEGNLALSVIEKVKKVYLFETDEKWIEALKATFAPWKEKVEIINKFVSDKNDERNISLDEFFKDKTNFNFLKIDAEGAENKVLQGTEKILSSKNAFKLALCCYHKPNDQVDFSKLLLKKDFVFSFSEGYMFFNEPTTFSPPFLRKGIMRAEKLI